MTMSGLPDNLESRLPQWPTGLAGRGLMLRHLEDMLRLPQTADLTAAAHDLALWRWQLMPWDQQTIAMVSALGEISGRPSLPDWARKLQTQVSAHFLEALKAISGGQTDRVARLWRSHGANSGHAVWLGETCLFFMQRGEEALARVTLDSARLPASHPVRTHLGALIAHCFDPPEIAIRSTCQLPDDFHLISTLLEGQCLLRMGDRRGVDALKNLRRAISWHPNLTLKLHDLMASQDSPAPANARTAVLLYSWNNAELLQQTLNSLSQSDLGDASVLVLDNGSSDRTPDVLCAAAEFFGNRLKYFSLPVNIGAPAARNWLLRHPETASFDTVVFLDDDVLLPHDWLSELNAQFRRAGKNAIVGCRILDQAPRQSVQTADVNLLDIEANGDFLIANAGGGELDLGLHDYTRPCLSVTGCCHMMDRERAVELGGFDLRFNPSQFDDFDLDLRNALHGSHAVYVGGTAVRHCQRSSLNQADSEAKQGHIQGNMLKLNTKYSATQKAELLRKNRELLWNDLLAKTRDLENM
jgi:GT2 family glycosyltransferase